MFLLTAKMPPCISLSRACLSDLDSGPGRADSQQPGTTPRSPELRSGMAASTADLNDDTSSSRAESGADRLPSGSFLANLR